MRNVLRIVTLSIVLVGLSLPVSATEISLSPSTPVCGSPECLMATGNQTSNAEVLGAIEGLFPSLVFNSVYKQNVGDAYDTGPASAWYATVFTNSPTDPSGAVITWALGAAGFIGAPTYLLVKDGKQIPAWYLFNISNWGGQDPVNLAGFWPNQGAISHVEIFGTTTTTVPDGASMAMLLGMALLGLAGLRRMTV